VLVTGLLGYAFVVHENLGRGVLRARPAVPLAGAPIGAAAGDFDRDGRLDLAVSLPSAGAVDIYLGDGALGFRLGSEVAIDPPHDVRAGDLDGDGLLDLVVARFEPGGGWTVLGDGRGGFGAPRSFDAPGGTTSLALGDVDGDGKLDVAAACANADQVALFRGDGRGGLTLAQLMPTADWPSSVTIADLDGAPPLDMLAVTNLGDTCLVAPGGAAGVEIPVGHGPFAATVADLDLDGRAEVAVTNKFANSISIFDRDLAPLLELPAGDGPTPIVAADLDGDGFPDLAVANGFSNDVVLYLSR